MLYHEDVREAQKQMVLSASQRSECNHRVNELANKRAALAQERVYAIALHSRCVSECESAQRSYQSMERIASFDDQRYAEDDLSYAQSELMYAESHLDEIEAQLRECENKLKTARATLARVTCEYEQHQAVYNTRREMLVKRIIRRAKIPEEYLRNLHLVKVVQKCEGGEYHVYFGGVDPASGTAVPDGDGHGHYVLTSIDPDGRVSYRRDPGESHGSHNHIDDSVMVAC